MATLAGDAKVKQTRLNLSMLTAHAQFEATSRAMKPEQSRNQ
ncbi:MAG TPA: hypothetical protein VFA81_11645 [Burkholderiales bacterium]|nr:hypothetical protein [Burkholderiales bacterium]